ncbi:MAG: hypothetical protein AB9828_04400 [Sphaerochaetaceae bacterium]
MSDIVFIAIPEDFQQEFNDFRLDHTKLLPVQLPEGKTTIDPQEGINVGMIAAALIKLLAYHSDHADTPYYRQLLVALQPDVSQELQVAAIAKAKIEDFDFAEELFLAANHLEPTIPELYVDLAVLYAQQAKKALDAKKEVEYDFHIEKQLAILKEGLGILPLSELLLSEIGMLNLYLGNEEIALDYLQQYLRVAVDSEKKNTLEARAKQLSDKLEDDRTLYEAFDQMQLHNEEQALRLINTFIEHKPKVWSGWFIKGWALRSLGDFEAAGKAFITCLELGGKNADIYNELSICALESGNIQLAKDYLSIAIDLEDTNVKLLTNLAYLHLRDEEYNQVYELYLKASSVDPEDPAVKNLALELEKRTGGQLEDNDVIDIL